MHSHLAARMPIIFQRGFHLSVIDAGMDKEAVPTREMTHFWEAVPATEFRRTLLFRGQVAWQRAQKARWLGTSRKRCHTWNSLGALCISETAPPEL